MKHHNTEAGPKPCDAKIKCPLDADHFDSFEKAQEAYEASMSSQEISSVSRRFVMPMSKNTEFIVKKLQEAGIRPLIVGGSVRDQFYGSESKDVDIELYGAHADGSSLDFEDVKAVFHNVKGVKVDEAGASFSVLKVYVGGEDYDLSLPRTEKSTGDGHTDYDVEHDTTMSFEEGASRRDFTLNSMGYDPATKELLDPFNGADDLKAGILRHPGPAFSDDPLRCLRAVSFASRFNLKIAPETLKLCQDLAPTYSTIPKERVEEEFNKAFSKGTHVGNGFAVLHDIGWAAQMKPFKDCSREELVSYGEKLDTTDKKFRKTVLSKLMTDAGRPDPVNTLDSSVDGRRFVKLNKQLMETVEKGEWSSTVAAHRAIKKLYGDTSNESLSAAFKNAGVQDTSGLFSKLPETPAETVVTGKAMLERGFKPGPEMGRVINAAQQVQDETQSTDFDWLMAKAIAR